MKNIILLPLIAAFSVACASNSQEISTSETTTSKEAAQTGTWQVDFFDDFDTFNTDNWQDQILWVNGEVHCYVRDNLHNTREVSDGTLKVRVVKLDQKQPCDNMSKKGEQHPDTEYVAGRIASKNLKEFVQGKWTARLRVPNSGQTGMFPAWWLLGAQNNEPPVQEEDENVCWPMTGSGELDIFEHHGDGGPDHYAARTIKSLGYCDGGDWQAKMLVQEAKMDEYHDYSVEWNNNAIIFRLDEEEVYRVDDPDNQFPEPLFAILNFAKINDAPMQDGTTEWVMEVDWVKHESLQ